MKPSIDELNIVIDIAANLSRTTYNPPYVYDEWAIPNFTAEYLKKRKHLSPEYLALLEPIYLQFAKFNYELLPKSFVHGDITSTNLMKDVEGNIWLIDFSVSNFMARIIEPVIICIDLALVMENRKESQKRIDYCFNLWCKKVDATLFEKESFYLLFSVANAINILNTTYEIRNGNTSNENKMHMDQGLFGLSLFKNSMLSI
jgi:hypothetical protein